MVGWILAALVLCYSFTGSLISALTVPALEKPPESWQDLIDRNYVLKSPVYIDSGDLTGKPVLGMDLYFTEYASEGSVFHAIGKRLVETRFGGDYRDFNGNIWDDNDYLDGYKHYLARTRGLALLHYSGSYRFVKQDFNSTGDRVLHEGKMNSFATYFSMVLRKQFLYYEAWTVETRLYWEMGLPYKWANMENYYVSPKILTQHERPLKAEKEPTKPLRLEHVYGPLIFLSAMLFTWPAVFFAELYSAK